MVEKLIVIVHGYSTASVLRRMGHDIGQLVSRLVFDPAAQGRIATAEGRMDGRGEGFVVALREVMERLRVGRVNVNDDGLLTARPGREWRIDPARNIVGRLIRTPVGVWLADLGDRAEAGPLDIP